MKEINIDKLTLALQDFWEKDTPNADDICQTLAEIFDLHVVIIFQPLKDNKSIEFSKIGSFPKQASLVKKITFSDLPQDCQEFWSSTETEYASFYRPRYCQTISDLSKKINLKSEIEQLGLLKFYWANDEKKIHFMIVAVEEKYTNSSIEPFFTKSNLRSVKELANILLTYLYIRHKEHFWETLKEFDKCIEKRSRFLVLEVSQRLLQGFKEEVKKMLSSVKQDYIWSTYLDMETSLKILPARKTNSRDGVLDIPESDDYPLTKLAIIRRDCWKKTKETKGLDCLEKLWERTVKLNYNISDKLKLPKNPLLSDHLVKKLQEVVSNNWLKLELIRTHFFCLYHCSDHIYPLWDCSSIEKLHDILFKSPLENEDKDIIVLTIELLEDFLITWQEDKHLVITSDWLAAWFGLMLLRSDFLNKEDLNRIYSPNELSQFYKHLACYFLYIFHWIKHAGYATAFKFSDVERGYEQVIESTLYLLSEYTHVELMLPRSVILFKALMDMWASEAILYTVHQTYREHLHHAVDLCLMGLLFIKGGFLPSERDNLRNWILAALLHDVGYGLNLNRLILDYLDFLGFSPVLKDYLQNLKKEIEIHETTLCQEIQRRMPSYKINNMDHGVISAIFTCALNRATQGLVDKGWLDYIRPALEAIIKHNLPGVSVDPQKEPLSFLLLLCDHLQEWDRPRVDKRFRYYLSANLLRIPGHPPSTTTLIQYIKTNLEWDEQERKWCLPRKKWKFEFIFKDASEENFEPVMIWCNHSFDLQKVKCEKLSQEIELSFIHPIANRLKNLKGNPTLTEMNLFRDFVREQREYAAFSAWLAAIYDKEQKEYQYDDSNEEKEKFCIILKKPLKSGQNTKLIPFLPSGLYKKFLSWKIKRIQTIELKKESMDK